MRFDSQHADDEKDQGYGVEEDDPPRQRRARPRGFQMRAAAQSSPGPPEPESRTHVTRYTCHACALRLAVAIADAIERFDGVEIVIDRLEFFSQPLDVAVD